MHERPDQQACHARADDEDRLLHAVPPQQHQPHPRDERRRHIDDGAPAEHEHRTAPAIAPLAAAVVPETNARNCALSRCRWNHGAGTMVNTYTGRKMPTAASVAPLSPATR